MKTLGLTGGIGSGKTTVAAQLAALGIPVVDADQIARDIVEPGAPALAELAAEFGADVVDDTGALRRGVLAERAFTDDAATARLNAIMHPRIRQETARRLAELDAAGHPVVVYDMPLLVDLGLDKDMDLVVVVAVDPEERVRRLVAHRGLEPEDARRRIAQQVSEEERRAAADVIIDNHGTLEELRAQVEQCAAQLPARLGVPLVKD
ncbi:dephospho-CoA kinase [Corynebacterium sp. 13CS0277]|uniref:dephospho-CoA kinase n=1 Tax=Corynebacterium sp. 13CS0277 TaxID=2071994 RepID=UPI000D03EF4A|nr:dephospho-CoA kinase [Corynebacterium sp. 13CS0277]PRQ11240.1 dephospho-CoA kinase [Corynebacterium sp. 13CS0277]